MNSACAAEKADHRPPAMVRFLLTAHCPCPSWMPAPETHSPFEFSTGAILHPQYGHSFTLNIPGLGYHRSAK